MQGRAVLWALGALLLLTTPAMAEVCLTDEEATELEATLNELARRSTEQEIELSEARKALGEARSSLEKAAKSYEEREIEWRESLRRRTVESDCWQITAMATGVAGIIAVIVTLLIR